VARYKVLEQADKSVPQLSDAIEESFRQAQKRVLPLTADYESGYVSELVLIDRISAGVADAIVGGGIKSDRTSVWEAILIAAQRGADAAISDLDGVQVEKASVGTSMNFDLLNPDTIKFLQIYKFELIQNISNTTREAIRQIMLDGVRNGEAPSVIARNIRLHIGLTAQQAQAVLNYKRALEKGQGSIALQNALRDQRFDSTVAAAINAGKPLPKEKIQKLVGAYLRKSLKYRAETIARSESIRASTIGQNIAWRQARDQNLLPTTMRRYWVITKHDTCELCKDTRSGNKDGVGMDEAFQTPIGPTDGPPLHPRCRCTLVIKHA